MNNPASFVFYAIFAVILVGMYLGIRRGWGQPGFVAAVGIVGSVISMLLMSLSQGNAALHAVAVGLVVGGLFSGVTLAIAWYFHTRDIQAQDRQTNEAAK
jgi:O-antigen/teichoic acid export membrane protein